MKPAEDSLVDEGDLVRARELVLELTLLGAAGADLDLLLDRLFVLLQRYPKLRIEPRGAILLFSPGGALVQVTHGADGMTDLLPACRWESIRRHPELRGERPFIADCRCAAGADRAACERPVLALPLAREGEPLGVVVVFLDRLSPPAPLQQAFLGDLAGTLSGIIARHLVEETLRVRELELMQAHADAIRRLGVASEYRDNETGWHIMRMANFAVAVAKAMGLSEAEREILYISAPMHDVGKIGITDAILLKPGKLTPEEFEVMKQHTSIGERLLDGADALIGAARDIAGSHHERWDGSGYPRCLRGDEIPLLARICAVADVFDALTSTRPYKAAWEVDAAVEFVIAESGRHFDPQVVDAFVEALPEVLRIRQLYRDDIINPREILALPKLPEREHVWLRWDHALDIGIDVIDEHHRFLFDLVNDLHGTVVHKRGAREVARALSALDIYAKVHFRAEEQMMSHYGFAGLDRQHRQHEAFEHHLTDFHEALRVNPLTTQFEMLEFLSQWLLKHIRHEDAQLRALVAS